MDNMEQKRTFVMRQLFSDCDWSLVISIRHMFGGHGFNIRSILKLWHSSAIR